MGVKHYDKAFKENAVKLSYQQDRGSSEDHRMEYKDNMTTADTVAYKVGSF